MPTILLLAALLATEPQPRPIVQGTASPADQAAAAAPAVTSREQSLAMIARAMAIQTIAMEAMLGPVESEARKSLPLQADLAKLEARYPGVSDVLVKAIIGDFRARLMKLDATIESDVKAHFGATLSDRTLAALASLAAIIAKSFDDKIPTIAQAPDVESAKRVDIAQPTQAQLDPIFKSLRQEPGGRAAVEDLFSIQKSYGAMQDRALATMYCETLEPAAKAAMAFLKSRGARDALIAQVAKELAETGNTVPGCKAAADSSPRGSTDRSPG